MQLFEWQQPFTGGQPEISAAEQRQASDAFATYVGRVANAAALEQDCLTVHAVVRRVYALIGMREADYVYFRTMYPLGNLMRPQMFASRHQPWNMPGGDGLGERVIRVVSLTADSSSYEIDEEGTLVRWDRTADYYSQNATCGSGYTSPWLSGMDMMPNSKDEFPFPLRSKIENRRLELEMRLNGQPVGLTETQNLLAVHDQAVGL